MSLSYTSSQRKGIIFLLIIIASLVLYKLIHDSVSKNQKILALEFVPTNKSQVLSSNVVKNSNVELKLDRNPNNWSQLDWQNLGFSNKQIKAIFNYKNKLGGFKTKEQLFNCYVLNHSHKKLLDSITDFEVKSAKSKTKKCFFEIDQSEKPNYHLNMLYDSIYYMKKDGKHCYFLKYSVTNIKRYFKNKSVTEKDVAKQHIDLDKLKLLLMPKNRFKEKKVEIMMNTADTNQWKSLNGIGSKRANRIVKYRSLLGGFISKNQLNEVYGFSKILVEEIKPMLKLDSIKLKKININSASKEVMASHPYISWNLANAIMNYKIQHGLYDSLSKIKQIHLVNDELYRKIAPYISLD